MGQTTDYFLADHARAAGVLDSGPAGTGLPVLELTDVEPAVLGSKLWAIIADASAPAPASAPASASASNDGPASGMSDYSASGDLVGMAAGGECLVIQVTDGFVTALAELPDARVAAVTRRWSTAEEWPGSPEPEQLVWIVEGLRELARQVNGPDQHMYVWWTL